MDWQISRRSGGQRTLTYAQARPLRASSLEQTGRADDNPKRRRSETRTGACLGTGSAASFVPPAAFLPVPRRTTCVRAHALPADAVVEAHRHVPDLRPRALARDAAPISERRRPPASSSFCLRPLCSVPRSLTPPEHARTHFLRGKQRDTTFFFFFFLLGGRRDGRTAQPAWHTRRDGNNRETAECSNRWRHREELKGAAVPTQMSLKRYRLNTDAAE
ncbi:hypothetical protein MTO96_001020 [Rhipicephalus appendiculatus]